MLTTHAQISHYDTITHTLEFYGRNNHISHTIQYRDFISLYEKHTYYCNGFKSEQYTQCNTSLIDTFFQWSTEGKLSYLEIHTDTNYVEIIIDSTTGNILSRGEYAKGTYDTTIQMRLAPFSGYLSAYCYQGCVYPIGSWYTFYSNGVVESEGSYLPYHMLLYDSLTIISPPDAFGNTTYTLIAVATETKVRNGIWAFYNELGEKIREENYTLGKLESTLIYNLDKK